MTDPDMSQDPPDDAQQGLDENETPDPDLDGVDPQQAATAARDLRRATTGGSLPNPTKTRHD
jgi:hypothetical protein